jgi:hypothetical protein
MKKDSIVLVPANTKDPGVSIINVDPSLVVGGISITVSFMGAWFWKYILQPKLESVKHNFRHTLENDMKIQGRLYILLERLGAGRILLYQAHNGNTYSSGQHQWKVSVTHEALTNGTSSVKHWSQSETANEFLKNYPEILTNKQSFLSLTDGSMSDLQQMRHRFLNHGTEAILTVVVKGYHQDEIIGFISIHWTDKDDVPENVLNIENLHLEIDKISGLLLRIDHNPFLEGLNKLWKRS